MTVDHVPEEKAEAFEDVHAQGDTGTGDGGKAIVEALVGDGVEAVHGVGFLLEDGDFSGGETMETEGTSRYAARRRSLAQ
jgi:hypothetical protein